MGGHLQVKLAVFASPVSLISIVGDKDPFAPIEGGVAGTRKAQFMTRP
jgi:poly(3-hydroxybutyrate) depolymerase